MGDENNRKYLSKEGLILFVNTIKDWLFTKVDKVSGMGLSSNDYTTAEKEKLSDIDSGAQVNVIESITVNNVAQTVSSDKSVDITVPTAVSDLDNDANYATTDEVAAGLAEKQDALDYGTPTGDDVGKALVPKTISNGVVTSWEFDEAGLVDDVQINGTSVVQNGIANIPIANQSTLGVVKADAGTHGILINEDGYLYTRLAGANTMKEGENLYRPIVPAGQHNSVFYGLSKVAGVDLKNENVTLGEYPDEAKSAIQSMLGVPSVDDIPEVPVQDVEINGTSVVDQNGVANIPLASNNDYGVVKGSSVGSFNFTNGEIRINPASANEIKTGTNQYKALTPAGAQTTAFYGLAKAAGDTTQSQSSNAVGQYTDGAKSAIKTMLGFATQSDIASAISQITQISFEVVQQLPQVGQNGTIYLVQHQHGASDIYDEYIWITSSSSYEKIGNTDIDLTDYLQKSAVVSESDIDDIVAQVYAPTVGEEAVYLNKERLSYFWGEAKDYIDDGLATKMPNVTFGEEVVLMDTTEFTLTKDGDNAWYTVDLSVDTQPPNHLFDGRNKYTITINDTNYIVNGSENYSYLNNSSAWTGVCIGNRECLGYTPNNNYPFCIHYVSYLNENNQNIVKYRIVVYSQEQSTTITRTIKIVKQAINAEYIPEEYYKEYPNIIKHGSGRNSLIFSYDAFDATGYESIAEGIATSATGNASHASGIGSITSGLASHAEGRFTLASGVGSHSEGLSTTASGLYSHAEGQTTMSSGAYSHSEGANTTASQNMAHAEGGNSTASNYYAHAEGGYTTASGNSSHAEGRNTTASGHSAHSEGYYTTASGYMAHAEGYYSIANHAMQHVFGRYNIEDTSTATVSERGNYIEIVGNGTANDARSNARTLDWSGNEILSGKLTVGSNPINSMDVATKLYVDTELSSKMPIVSFGEEIVLMDTTEFTFTKDGDNPWYVTDFEYPYNEWSSHTTKRFTITVDEDEYIAFMEKIPLKVGSNVWVVNAIGNKKFSGAVPNNEYPFCIYFGRYQENNNNYAISKIYIYFDGSSDTITHTVKIIVASMDVEYVPEQYYKKDAKILQSGSGLGSVILGNYTFDASGNYSLVGGIGTKATGIGSCALGIATIASNNGAYSSGSNNIASGISSMATGTSTTASGNYSFSGGFLTTASGYFSHSEGRTSLASGNCAHAEGRDTQAVGNYTHAEGRETQAIGSCTHAEGRSTIANGYYSHVSGSYNIPDSYDNWSEWVANTEYHIGEKVKRYTSDGYIGYICITDNNDSIFDESHWQNHSIRMNYVEIIGNGTADDARSNAYALDWSGNGYFAGDVYVGCNNDSSGGTKLATVDDIVSDVQVNGTSVVSNGVANIPMASANVPGVVKTSNSIGITSGGFIGVIPASVSLIKTGTDNNNALTSGRQHVSVFYGLAKAAGDSTQSASDNAVGTYTAQAKTAIQTMLGVPSVDAVVTDVQVNGTSIISSGVANIPVASGSDYGVVKVAGEAYGVYISANGQLYTSKATDSQIVNGTNNYRPIVPSTQHAAVFYGLAKAAGDNTQGPDTIGQYTATAKAAIQTMLGVPSVDAVVTDVQVNGTSVTSNGVANIPIANGTNFGVVNINPAFGVGILNGYLMINSAISSDVKAGNNSTKAVSAYIQHESVFYGLSKAAGVNLKNEEVTVGTYPATAQTAIKSMLGVADGAMTIGTVTTLSPGTNATASITGDYSAMELNLGIPRGSSGVYIGSTAPTDSDIDVWIDTTPTDNPYVETITGTTVTIVGEPNCRYMCGTVLEITITPPTMGTIEVIFTSGSSPAVMTLPNTVIMPEWWEGIEANYTYDICITDGIYAGVSSWPV